MWLECKLDLTIQNNAHVTFFKCSISFAHLLMIRRVIPVVIPAFFLVGNSNGTLLVDFYSIYFGWRRCEEDAADGADGPWYRKGWPNIEQIWTPRLEALSFKEFTRGWEKLYHA
jgi:hypothetical protein